MKVMSLVGCCRENATVVCRPWHPAYTPGMVSLRPWEHSGLAWGSAIINELISRLEDLFIQCMVEGSFEVVRPLDSSSSWTHGIRQLGWWAGGSFYRTIKVQRILTRAEFIYFNW